LQATQKKVRKLSVQPGRRGSNDLRVGRKMATFQLFFHSGQAKDLSAPLCFNLIAKNILFLVNRSIPSVVAMTNEAQCAGNVELITLPV